MIYKRPRKVNLQRYGVVSSELRAKILKRDKYKCALCNSKKPLQIHHIIRFADSVMLRDNPENLISLCRTCHNKIKNQEHIYVDLLRMKINANSKNNGRK